MRRREGGREVDEKKGEREGGREKRGREEDNPGSRFGGHS